MTVNYSQRVRPETSVSPLRFMDNATLGYDRDGNVFLPHELQCKIPSSAVMLVVPIKENRVSAHDLAQAKEFARKYLVEPCAKMEERQCYAKKYAVLPGGERIFVRPRSHVKIRQADWATKSEEDLAKALSALTIEKVNSDVQALNLLTSRSDRQAQTITATLKQNLTSAFQTMPEWMQILTHEHGAYVTTEGIDKGSLGQSIGDRYNPGVFAICVSAKFLEFFQFVGSRQNFYSILREELIHELQKHSDFYDGIGKTPGFERVKPLIAALDDNSEHLALRLIKHTEAGVNSLMSPEFKKNMHLRIWELMVDIYDAEIYLRRAKEISGKEAELQLKEAFGEDAYALSREYVNRWMDQAEKILAQKVGSEKAHEYHEKWVKAPFTHRITLTQLPGYQLHSARQML